MTGNLGTYQGRARLQVELRLLAEMAEEGMRNTRPSPKEREMLMRLMAAVAIASLAIITYGEERNK